MDESKTKRFRALQESYDLVAEEYGRRYFNELEHKPLDRQLMNSFADEVKGLGSVCDLGCGPGQVARYLHERGVSAFGIDLSPEMVKLAKKLSPHLEFRRGNMLALDDEDESWGGVAAFYSIIHIPRDDLSIVMNELFRVLEPGGLLLMAFHTGEEDMHVDELWDEDVSMDFYFFEIEFIEHELQNAGFEIEEVRERPPYPDVEYQSQRAYILARKPKQ